MKNQTALPNLPLEMTVTHLDPGIRATDSERNLESEEEMIPHHLLHLKIAKIRLPIQKSRISIL